MTIATCTRMRASAVALLLAGVIASGCGEAPSRSALASEDPPAPATLAGPRELVQTWLLTGTLESTGSALVTVPRLPSWETTIRFAIADGTAVRAGDRLIELDTSQVASELDNKVAQRELAANDLATKQAEVAGQIAQKEFALRKAEVELRKAEVEASVPEDLQDRRGYEASLLRLDEARVAREKADADLDGYRASSAAEIEVARVELARTDRELADARAAIENMVLRAPRDGLAVIAENRREGRKFQEGDTIQVGSLAAEIPDLQAMSIRAELSDVDDGKIAVGMPASCYLDAYPERAFACQVAAISPVASEPDWRSLRRTFEVRVALQEIDAAIMRPGMSVRVEVETARTDGALVVSRRALRWEDGRVMAAREGDWVEVEIEACDHHDCVVALAQPGGLP